jgi:putative oxidoreductase
MKLEEYLSHPVVPLIGRLCIVYIYATSGYAKIFGWEGNVQYMSRFHLPMIPVLLVLATIVEVVGSICLITGYQARIAAFVMFGYTLILTLLLHNYWTAPPQIAGMQETHFRKNLAIMGGLLMVSYVGPGAWSLGKRKRAIAAAA